MVFSSLVFLFRFLPIFLICYFILPKNCRNLCLLVGSVFFYAHGEPVYVFLILCSVLFNFSIARLMDEFPQKSSGRKFFFIFSLITNFGLLFFFKYLGFFLENLNLLFGNIPIIEPGLPLGISFYTFQIVSYVIDVYKKEYPAEKKVLDLAVYLCMFPQLIAGPIITYPQIKEQLKNRKITKADFEEGLGLFILGLGSKVILANRIGILWHSVQTLGYEDMTMPYAWLGAIAFSFQIYFDFYGYSLMAMGLGKMMGFTIPENFLHPYLSLSMTEFFRKWHVTLGNWFKKYVYIPLGGNRNGFLKTIRNLLFVWLLTGIWHGASWNFVLWGLFIVCFIIMEKLIHGKLLNFIKPLGMIYMLILVPVSWMLFAITDLSDISLYLNNMFSFVLENHLFSLTGFFDFCKPYTTLLFLCLVCMTKLPNLLFETYRKKPVGVCSILFIFWLSVYYLANSINNPFLYFRF